MKSIELTEEDHKNLKQACLLLRFMRKKSGQTIKELSENTGISVNVLQAIEKESYEQIDLKTFFLLCHYYCLLPSQILNIKKKFGKNVKLD